MKLRPIREWESLAVGDFADEQTVTRKVADGLIATARASKLGGVDGETILVNGHRRLRARQTVGLIVSSHATLEILPKIDGLDEGRTRQNLVRMLAKVLDLKVADGALADLDSQHHDLLELLVRLFCSHLFDALRRGLPRRYVGQEEDLPTQRGRLNVQRQFTTLAASPHTLACRYDDLSADIALNHVMKAAVTRLRSLARSTQNQRGLGDLSFAYADVSNVPVNLLSWDHVVMDRTNAAWAPMLKLARLLLGDRFQTTSSGDRQGFSLLFEMNTLFEEYIGRVLQRALSSTGLEVTMQGPRSFALEDENKRPRFATRPDIVVCRNGRPVLVLDTKWKRLTGAIDDPKGGVGQADVYQMMAYAQVYQCDRLMLLYPHHAEIGAPEGVLDRHRIRGKDDSQLSIATVSLSDLSDVGERLIRMVESTITGMPHLAGA